MGRAYTQVKDRTHRLGDTLDIVTQNLTVALRSAPISKQKPSQHRRLPPPNRTPSTRPSNDTQRPLNESHRRERDHSLSKTLSSFSAARHCVRGLVAVENFAMVLATTSDELEMMVVKKEEAFSYFLADFALFS